jgi:hypothetical protein
VPLFFAFELECKSSSAVVDACARQFSDLSFFNCSASSFPPSPSPPPRTRTRCAPQAGGISAQKPVDDEVRNVYASVAAAVEAQAGVAGAHEIRAYATQVVAGTNFFVKVWLFCPGTQMLMENV